VAVGADIISDAATSEVKECDEENVYIYALHQIS
jgi:hypothetical protein